MAHDPDKPSSKRPSFDPALQTEDIAFSSDEMVACGCGRTNPPNRQKCLYCGRELEITIDALGTVKASMRPLELWERGFNVVFTGCEDGSRIDLNLITTYLPLERDKAQAIFDADTPLPLVRVESLNDADVVQRELGKMGLKTVILSDVDLASDKLPTRLSGMSFETGSISVREFNSGKITRIPVEDLIVLVSGVLAKGRVEAIEKRRRGSTEVIDEAATMFDEAVLDIYARGYPHGFRVNMAGFDFSCLESEKELLAGQNLAKLIAAIRTHAPNAALVDNYQTIRHRLDGTWDIESRRSGTGLQRTGFARRDYGSVTSSSNLDQFTRYSRLQRLLYETKR
jgi:hypothetical protein